MPDEAPRAIVVGVDGSPSSVDALRWAMRQVQATNAEAHAVAAWEVPVPYDYDYAPYDNVDWEGEADKTLDRALAELGEAGGSTMVTKRVVHGHPGTVLVEESRDADLLVVGSRGHGTAAGMLLGSVSQYCVHHASCPVVVVRAHKS